MLFSLTLKRASRLVTLVGLVAFAASFGALTIFAADWAAIIIPAVPQTVLTTVLAAIIAQFAMSNVIFKDGMITRNTKVEQRKFAREEILKLPSQETDVLV